MTIDKSRPAGDYYDWFLLLVFEELDNMIIIKFTTTLFSPIYKRFVGKFLIDNLSVK